MDKRAIARKEEIEAAVADVRQIEKKDGVTRASLEKIKQRLMRLAARQELFTAADYPPPQPGSKRNSCLYRVAEDADHRFALYVNSSDGNYGTPAHNHTTWAVIVGVSGEELNRFYDRVDSGVKEKGNAVVKQGTGVAFMPEDLHSIHIQAPLINFHMYGLALEELHHREYYKTEERAWKVFPPHSDIREAR
ncbi:MAG TPA: cysteine dioxygenase [Burkholderiales bacterium]|jgi:predicted metal-dependent enzyme (double-stranded beta helix superfamily)|nr:cysteine dioxygenase [Burkholderiales bacterium]